MSSVFEGPYRPPRGCVAHRVNLTLGTTVKQQLGGLPCNALLMEAGAAATEVRDALCGQGAAPFVLRHGRAHAGGCVCVAVTQQGQSERANPPSKAIKSQKAQEECDQSGSGFKGVGAEPRLGPHPVARGSSARAAGAFRLSQPRQWQLQWQLQQQQQQQPRCRCCCCRRGCRCCSFCSSCCCGSGGGSGSGGTGSGGSGGGGSSAAAAQQQRSSSCTNCSGVSGCGCSSNRTCLPTSYSSTHPSSAARF